MADLSKLKHILDIGDPSFNMTAPENIHLPEEEASTPENDPTAFAPAEEGSDEEESPAQSNPGPLASAADIAKIQAIPLPASQASVRSPAQQAAPQASPANSAENDEKSSRLQHLQSLIDSVNNLKPAQDKYKDDLGNIAVLQGGNQIAQAMAARYGGKIGDGSDAIKSLKEQAQRPVQEIEENLKLAQEGVKSSNASMELQRLQQAADKNSSISKLARQQAATGMAMLTGAKRGSPEFDAAVQKYVNQFDGMSALDLEKGAFGKTGLLGKSPTTSGFGQFIDAKTGHPLISRSFMGQTEVVDSVTGQPIDPNTAQVVRPIGYTDPQTGNRGYLTNSGMIIPGQKNDAEVPADPNKEYTMADLNKVNPKFADKQVNTLRNLAAHDEELKKIRESNRSAGVLFTKLQGLDPAHPGEIDSGLAPSLAAQMASMAQGGNSRIAAEFINKYNGAGGVENRLKRYIENNLSGKLTSDDRNFFAEAGEAFKRAGDEMYAPIAQNYANQLKSLFPDKNLSDDNAKKLLGLDQSLVLKNKPMEDYKKNVTNKGVSKPKTVIQNGHTFKLNEATGEYE